MLCSLCGEDRPCCIVDDLAVCLECVGEETAPAGSSGNLILCSVSRPSNCWIPDARGRTEDGRVIVRIRNVKQYLYRAVWESLMGPCPENLTPDHLCLNPQCVNPTHIEWVTREENASRSWTRGRRRR